MFENTARVSFLAHVLNESSKSNNAIIHTMKELTALVALHSNMKASKVFKGLPDAYSSTDANEVANRAGKLIEDILDALELPREDFSYSLIEMSFFACSVIWVRNDMQKENFYESASVLAAALAKMNGLKSEGTFGEQILFARNSMPTPLSGETKKAYLNRINKLAGSYYEIEQNRIEGTFDGRAANWLWEQFRGMSEVTLSQRDGVSEETERKSVQALRAQLGLKRPRGRPRK